MEAAVAKLLNQYTIEQTMMLLEMAVWDKFCEHKGSDTTEGMQKALAYASVINTIKSARLAFLGAETMPTEPTETV